MKLYIAEKPSVARTLADATGINYKRDNGFIQLSNGDCITWCIGHLLEQAKPERYDEKFRQWRCDNLPILPAVWLWDEKASTKKQLSVVKTMVKKAKVLIHVGDPDREGQLLVDEVIHYLKVPKAKRNAMLRCLINDLNLPAVKKALGQLRSNQEFIPLSTSALARARADWIYGINLTRMCTVLAKQAGFSGLLSIGRVQTPVLGLVVKRDDEIENFTSKPFFELYIECLSQREDPQACQFWAKWSPNEGALDIREHQDENKRCLNKAVLEALAHRLQNKKGVIKHHSKKPTSQAPPLPYNLSNLQIDAAKIFALSAKDVLDICQSLYERHKLITYPRSDCRYLPLSQFADAEVISKTCSKGSEARAALLQYSDSKQKSAAWNDKKVNAHHAIIPTRRGPASVKLSANEAKVYDLIARRYLMQFMQHARSDTLLIKVELESEFFISKNAILRELGWQRASIKSRSHKPSDENVSKAKISPQVFETLKKGQGVSCHQTEIDEKQTTPPKPFSDATLLAAMTGIARYVDNPEIKKILKDTDGIGTEATRASIIELLFNRQYLVKKGKLIHATDVGKQLIYSIPEAMSKADMTAEWEQQLNAISEQRGNYKQFMNQLDCSLRGLIHALSGSGAKAFIKFKSLHAPATAFSKKSGRKTMGGSGKKVYAKQRKKINSINTAKR